ncbi:MAG TPA: 2-oxoacid:acceptor oxidoreductase family protein, partial [Thermoanaerobaculia bacterium]
MEGTKAGPEVTMEIRIHGRGGQGGVTCAKLLAAVYARLGKSVQAFGDYAGERSGAPVRAYVRVADAPITNRNKVYRPDHLLVLDRTLLDAQALSGLAPGGLLLVNTAEPPAALADPLGAPVDPDGTFRRAAVDATAVARRHGIGSRSVVIVNTTIAGAFARALDLPWEALEEAYGELGLAADLPAAREAWEGVRVAPAAPAVAPDPVERPAAPAPTGRVASDPVRPPVLDLVDHRSGPAPALRTGSWRSQTPRYAKHLSPCNASCPAGNDVGGFVQAL